MKLIVLPENLKQDHITNMNIHIIEYLFFVYRLYLVRAIYYKYLCGIGEPRKKEADTL
jgi:hypothetical protein